MWPSPKTRTPAPGIMEFTILVDPSLDTYFVWSMPGPRDEDLERNDAISSSLYYLNGHTLAQEPLHKGVCNLKVWYTLPWSSLLYSQIAWNMRRRRKEFLKKNTLFTAKLSPLGWGYAIYNICLITLKILHVHTKFCKDWPSRSWEDVNRRPTPIHCNRSPAWFRWPLI